MNKTKVSDLMKSLETSFPAYYNLNYNFRVENLDSLLTVIDDNVAILQYFESNDHVFLLMLSKGMCKIYRMPAINKSAINDLWKQFDYQSVMAGTQEDFVNFQVLTNQIYNELVKAPLDSLGNLKIDKLYFIPDKSLYGLPLDILATEVNTSARPNYKNIKYLINDYDISYDYSISSIFNKRIINDGTKVSR